MEFLIVSVGILLALIVTAAVIDLKSRRVRRRIAIDPATVRDARRINAARADQYDPGAAVRRDYGSPF